jgi:hypothetical protein
MSNSITPRIAPQFVPQNRPSENAAQPQQASVAAEAQISIFQRLPSAALVKPPLALPAAYAALPTAARKKAHSSDFAAPEEGKDEIVENSTQATATMLAVRQSGEQGNSDGSSDERDQTQFVYQRKLDELTQICVPGMSAADAAHAKELAMQVVLCANVSTLAKTKSTRELSQVIGQMVQKLALGGASLPTDTAKLLDLLKTQSANLPTFLRMRLEDKNSITGHLLPLLLLALRRQSPVLPTPNSFMMYGEAA